jgi:uncharacterized protein (DUF302 family)
MSYHFAKSVSMTFDDAICKVTEEQKREGFGIFIEIDVKQMLKKKLEVAE